MCLGCRLSTSALRTSQPLTPVEKGTLWSFTSKGGGSISVPFRVKSSDGDGPTSSMHRRVESCGQEGATGVCVVDDCGVARVLI